MLSDEQMSKKVIDDNYNRILFANINNQAKDDGDKSVSGDT